jgi:hypothetical protein
MRDETAVKWPAPELRRLFEDATLQQEVDVESLFCSSVAVLWLEFMDIILAPEEAIKIFSILSGIYCQWLRKI